MKIAIAFAFVLLAISAMAGPQDIRSDSIEGQGVGRTNDNFRSLNQNKLDNRPGDVIPKTGSKYYLGSASYPWKGLYVDSLIATIPGLGVNRVINGDMEISQRVETNTRTPGSGTEAYLTDRFVVTYTAVSKLSGQQVTDAPPGFNHSLKITTALGFAITAARNFSLQTRIEGLNVSDLQYGSSAASDTTLSFWVKCSSAGTFGLSISNYGESRSYVAEYTINAASTWEQKTITIPGDTSGTWAVDTTTGIAIRWALGTGSNFHGTAGTWASANDFAVSGDFNVVSSTGVTWQLTGVQLESGATASSFVYLPFATRLALCQRYYEKSYNIGVVPGTITSIGGFTGIRANGAWTATAPFHVSKVAAPTVTLYSPITGNAGVVRNNTTAADEAATSTNSGTNCINVQGTSVTTSDQIFYHWAADSDLL